MAGPIWTCSVWTKLLSEPCKYSQDESHEVHPINTCSKLRDADYEREMLLIHPYEELLKCGWHTDKVHGLVHGALNCGMGNTTEIYAKCVLPYPSSCLDMSNYMYHKLRSFSKKQHDFVMIVLLLQPKGGDQRMEEQMGRLQGSDTRPMAHLPATKQTEASAQELQWEPERGLALLRNGMTYSNKSLIIPKDGYYFVYSQLYFRPAASTCNDTSISQSIIRSNANYPEPEIILSGISFCSKGSKIYHPITLVGLIELKKGDKLKVNMKPVTQVDTSFDHKSFFGAFLL
ncbi:tumor necrosis factor ligand superfamily member 15 [Leptodactylus fuscus]|uniref:tumor necrosis factor ligand superfamily member 15 n=1 Tax=Leptodactylus fuscus TaxID=238119 RepID=UPI003F4EC58F